MARSFYTQPVRGRQVAGSTHPLLRERGELVNDVRWTRRLNDDPQLGGIEGVRDRRPRAKRQERLLLVGRTRERGHLMAGRDECTNEWNTDRS
jgi:hypothetical protein